MNSRLADQKLENRPFSLGSRAMSKRALLNISAFVGVLVLILAVMVFSTGRMSMASAQTVTECETIQEDVETPVSITRAVTGLNGSSSSRIMVSGLSAGDQVVGIQLNLSSGKFGSGDSIALTNNDGELSTYDATNGFYTRMPLSATADNSQLNLFFGSPTKVSSTGTFEISVPTSQRTIRNYTAIATVRTEREECTTRENTTPPVASPSAVETTTSPSEPTETTTSPVEPIEPPTSEVKSSTTATPEPSPSVDPYQGTGLVATQLRPARAGEVAIRVSAAAFRNDTSRYSSGLKFRLWTADDSGTLFQASAAGPQAAIEEDWATCVTGSTGECAIYIPQSFKGKYAFVVQENEYPGTFHIGEVNWGEYGNYNNRTSAALPGFINIMNMRTGSTDPYWGKMFTLDDPQVSTWKEIRTFGSSVQSLNNPPAEKARKCQQDGGPRIALVLDTTTSIADAGGTKAYREAVYGAGGFLDGLVGTGASVAFFPFAGDAKANTFPDPVPVDTRLAEAKANAEKALSIGGVTNWQAGFESVLKSGQTYDQIIFVTDGDANHWYVGGTTKDSVNVDGSVRGVEAGIYAANELKAKGMRIVSIGVASAKDFQYWNGSGQLKAVSGPQYGVDYFGTDWSRLTSALRAAASEVICQIEFEVQKVIVDETGKPVKDQSAASDWEMTLNLSGISNPNDYLMGGSEKAPFGYLSGDADQTVQQNNVTAKNQTYGSPARVRWTFSQYGDPDRSQISATLSENVNSKQGFNFLAKASTFEVQDSRTGQVQSRGTLTSSSQTFANLRPGQKVVVKMANQLLTKVEKSTNQSSATVQDGKWSAKYSVNLTGPSGQKLGKPLYDVPTVPEGFSVTSFKSNGEEVVEGVEGYRLAEESFVIPQSGEATFEVVVSGTAPKNPDPNRADLKCSDQKTGLYNEVVMNGDSDGTENNYACIPVEVPAEFAIGVEKWDDDGNLGNPEPGNRYGFAIQSPNKITHLTEFTETENGGGYLTADLKLEPGITYQLIETTAPEGFELLPAPVSFTIEKQKDGSYKLWIPDSTTVANVVAVNDTGNPNLRILKVTDVRRGELPHTGGVGIQIPFLLGFGLIVAGIVSGRRKVLAA